MSAEQPPLLDIRAHDGSRQFAALPATHDWYAVRDHVGALAGAELTAFVCDGVTEAWIDFSYRGQAFSINDPFGEYWFFANDATCDEQTLLDIVAHWKTLLEPGA